MITCTNYQIEHHLFPDIPLRQYQLIQPEIKALCSKYGVPYVQESVFKRTWMLVQICVGTASMKRLPGLAAGEDPKGWPSEPTGLESPEYSRTDLSPLTVSAHAKDSGCSDYSS
jgi:hypothetical protein